MSRGGQEGEEEGGRREREEVGGEERKGKGGKRVVPDETSEGF